MTAAGIHRAPSGPAAHPTLDEAPVAIVAMQADGMITAVNAAWCEVSGLTAEGSLGDGWLAVVDADDRERLLAGIFAAAGDGPAVDRLLIIGADRRRTRWLSRRRLDDSGLVMAVIALVPAERVGPIAHDADPRVMSVAHADALVRDLFTVGLTLASCVTIVEEPAGNRLRVAIEQLDRIIRDLHSVILGQHRAVR